MRARYCLIIFSLIFLAPMTQGYSNGITGAIVDSGCVCHGDGTYSDDTTITFEGVPVNWTAEETYTIYVNMTGPDSEGINSGGFNLRASTGELTAVDGMVQIVDEQATHTPAGNDIREWVLEWTAPSNTNQNVIFYLFANAVNGDSSANSMDHWNSQTISVAGQEQPVEESENNDFTTDEVVVIVVAIGVGLTFILITESVRIEMFEE
ncbi:MAG: hypothetical protein HOM85_03350 [Euryarchaeota archaeon]|nr:hypothetical protein [Euryarchaeota archaeon]